MKTKYFSLFSIMIILLIITQSFFVYAFGVILMSGVMFFKKKTMLLSVIVTSLISYLISGKVGILIELLLLPFLVFLIYYLKDLILFTKTNYNYPIFMISLGLLFIFFNFLKLLLLKLFYDGNDGFLWMPVILITVIINILVFYYFMTPLLDKINKTFLK